MEGSWTGIICYFVERNGQKILFFRWSLGTKYSGCSSTTRRHLLIDKWERCVPHHKICTPARKKKKKKYLEEIRKNEKRGNKKWEKKVKAIQT